MSPAPLGTGQRAAILVAVFLGLLFDGLELGLMPVASLSVSKSLLGEAFTPAVGGDWFARFTASLMLGAALGGIFLGALGDRIGRARGMAVSILFYSGFAAMGGLVQTQEQMLALRFLSGLGVGGMWPNGIALVSECWRGASRPLVSGVMMAGLNTGILLLSQLARFWPITPDSWRWIFHLAGFPATLGILIWFFLPESPAWLASKSSQANSNGKKITPLVTLFQPGLIRHTLLGIALSSIPMVGAWAASKWMIPWADEVAKSVDPGYKAATQGWWSVGAVTGSVLGAQLAQWLGRRLSYFLISIGAITCTLAMFQGTAPLEPGFQAIVLAQGLVSTLFFGWLAVYLPELFPTQVRSAGSGMAYNTGRFATAFGVLAAGGLFTLLGGNYPKVGSLMGCIYGLGALVIWLAPRHTAVDSSTEITT